MPDQNDPFAFPESGSSARTVLRPIPGGRPGMVPPEGAAAPEHDGSKPPAEPASPAPWPLSADGGLSRIERAASSLIALLGKLSHAGDHRDPERLRARVIEEIRVFETNAKMSDVPSEDIFVARYVLCTAIDEAVLNTPWGSNSGWGNESLLVTFHKEVSGGVRFFQLLNHMLQDPRGNLDLLQLMYICLMLGFEGQYRLSEGGMARLEEIKNQLYRTLRERQGDLERSLSPNWEGVQQGATALTAYLPIWVWAAGLGILLLAAYTVFSFKLNSYAAPAMEELSSIETIMLPQRGGSEVRRYPPERRPAGGLSLASLLATEVADGTLTIDEDAYRSLIVIRGDGLFASGKVEVRPEYVELLKRIARALEKFPGQVLVTGHTDDIPIQNLRFPSNWHLSRARAQAVLKILAAEAGPAERYRAEGRGEREPLAPNDTAANRARNRRVEIILLPYSGQFPGQSDR